ncbi:hypothetical protein [Hyphomicrobium sp.]|uniref:hypothetical protein n=1 Tax=Hyphomicrobium sp. TaxID=82 RepID=UPI000FBFFC05|nr:hypothetical protein [Hyphomicrobium sp.]RUP11226.1 MAG: hypothetical protein EKK38_01890 [Hyphomicrobium sp.]
MRLNSIWTFLASQRGSAFWLLAAASVLWFGYAAENLIYAKRTNENIRLLVSRHDVPVDIKRAHPQELLARIDESVRRDHIDDAQSILSIAGDRLPPPVRAAALYNIANTRTRLAAEAVRRGDIDSATAMINLAKSEYRLALKLDSENWDARHNLDVAMRVVRDFPPGDNPDLSSPDAPKKLWTDLPGIPKGLP